jgi:hypothetical protein
MTRTTQSDGGSKTSDACPDNENVQLGHRKRQSLISKLEKSEGKGEKNTDLRKLTKERREYSAKYHIFDEVRERRSTNSAYLHYLSDILNNRWLGYRSPIISLYLRTENTKKDGKPAMGLNLALRRVTCRDRRQVLP